MHIIDDLVRQFSDPMAFFRELVQNAIDSGTGEVEINLLHDQDRLEISISDWGEGMTREIIETKLVRLFSSGKDEDLTKIGRFGIGFVSVFAIEPQQVVVETGREGQFWRVLFSPDRTYQLFRSDLPLEGTRIRIFKSMKSQEFLAFRDRARKAVQSWCKFAYTPIYFDGEEIGEPFALSSACALLHEEEGTRVAMSFTTNRKADEIRAGYYNRGLTLREVSRSPFPWVFFRIDSRYLEHTLTRDQLLDDPNLQKAMVLLDRLALETLPEQLIDSLETAVINQERASELDELYSYLTHYLRCGQQLHRSWRRRPIFPTASGKVASLTQVQRAHRRGNLVLSSTAAPELIDSLGRRKLVLRAGLHLRELLEEVLNTYLNFLEKEPLSLPFLRTQQLPSFRPLKEALHTFFTTRPDGPDEILFLPSRSLGYLDTNSGVLFLPTRDEPIEPKDWKTSSGPDTTLVFDADNDPNRHSLADFAAAATTEPELSALLLMELLRPGAETSEELLLKSIQLRRRRLNQKEQ